jgi:hypothetical protein
MRLGTIRRTKRRTVVEAPIWKMRLAALTCLAFAGGMVVLAVVASPLWRQIFFAFGALPLAFAAFLGFARGKTTSVISVTDEGLELPIGFLCWDEIERVDFTVVAGRTSLGIWTYDPFVLARRDDHWWLWVTGFLAQIQRMPLISYTDFAAPIGDLYAAIETRRNRTLTQAESRWTGSTATSAESSRYILDESAKH